MLISGRPETPLKRPAVFLDRDGVIIENREDYVRSWQDVGFLPGVFESLRRLAASGYAIAIVTNQSAVGRGIITLAEAWAIHARIVAEMIRHGGRVDGSYLCPHRPEDGCTCRKPAPGLLWRAARELDLDLARSYMVGDAVSDLQAGAAAGAQSILVLTGRGVRQSTLLAEGSHAGGIVVDDLSAAITCILKRT